MNRILIFLLSIFICSSCGATHSSKSRGGFALHSQFDVIDSLQNTIKNIINKEDECHNFSLNKEIVLLEDVGKGQIVYISDQHVFLIVDLLKQDEKTHVNIYSRLKIFGWEKALQTLEYGAKGTPGCP